MFKIWVLKQSGLLINVIIHTILALATKGCKYVILSFSVFSIMIHVLFFFVNELKYLLVFLIYFWH